MAVFLSNVCKFNSCGLQFASLPELIKHIEEHHLDAPESPETTPSYMPVSCILRIFSSQDADNSSIDSNTLSHDAHHQHHHNHHHHHHIRKSINSPAASLNGSELESEDAESDSGQSSIDSWANMDSGTNQLNKFHQIMGSASGNNAFIRTNDLFKTQSHQIANSGKGVPKEDRIFPCNFNGCTKQYRNSNSLSHHRRTIHKINSGGKALPSKIVDESNRKIFKCTWCTKTYKTSHGLKSHCNFHHNANNNTMNNNSIPGLKSENVNGECLVSNNNILMSSPPPPRFHASESLKQENSLIHMNQTTTQSMPNLCNTSTIENLVSDDTNVDSMMVEKQQQARLRQISNSELIPDDNCPPVSLQIEICSEPKSSGLRDAGLPLPPVISAPTLQQHLLSPVTPKAAISVLSNI